MAAVIFSRSKVSSGLIESFAIGLLHQELRSADRTRYASYQIVRIVHYKEKTAIGHEFLALYLIMSDGTEEFIVRIERRPSTRKVASSSEFITDDSISRLDPNFDPDDYYHISTTTFGEARSFTLLDMCKLCATIREVAPIYSVGKGRHCYWFCAAFLDRLRAMGHIQAGTQEDKDYHRRGRFRGINLISEKSIRKKFAAALGDHSTDVWFPHSTFSGHTKMVMSVCFTLDGRYVVSGSYDRTVRIWDVGSGKAAGQPLNGHALDVNAVAVSPDGRHTISASDDKTMRIWDLETRLSTMEPLTGHMASVWSVAFSPDGRRIVSGSWDKSVRIWNAETRAVVGEPLKGHGAEVSAVAWSPEGSHIVSASFDGAIRVWDAQTRMPAGEPLGGRAAVTAVAVSPDGRHVVSASEDQIVRIWEVASGALSKLLHGHTGWVRSVAFSPDGRWIASGSDDGTVRIWGSADDGEGDAARLDAGSRVLSVAWSPAGDAIVAGCVDWKVRILSLH